MLQRKLTLIIGAIALLIFNSPIAAQQNFKIGKIDFEGLTHLSAEEMVETTGLKVGESFDINALDTAAQKLVDSGLFKNVGYRTRAIGDLITITFQVEEKTSGSSRVIFDNFIWFTDTELIDAVRREIPSFSGTAPDNGDMVERISKALQRFLHEHQIEATVNYMTSQDSPSSRTQEHVFSVIGVPMPICTIHFPGASNVTETRLVQSSKALFASEYSSQFVSQFALHNLIPIYRELGQLKAAFAPPLAKPEASATCKSGVELTIPVAEGHIYRWDKAEWSGINAMNSQELNGVIGMQSGQPANGLKLDRAGAAIREAYGRKGYLVARVLPHPQFDDEAQKVMYKIEVIEGPQFRMGKLIPRGFSSDVMKAVNERWGLKGGDVFDAGYALEFSRKQMGDILRPIFVERRAQGKPAPNVKWTTNLNKDNLTVDVTLELTN